MSDHILWVEQYRPKTIDDCIIPPKIKKTLKGFVAKRQIPNIIFTGTQGTGKTTCAKAIVRELGAESLFIDCSTDSGKAMIAEMVVPFASTVSIVNQDVPKFIICDESDGLTPDAMRSLRAPIERHSSNARFIFTGNYAEKFIPAIKSRCTHFDMFISKEDKIHMQAEFYKRCENILKENDVTFDQKSLIMFIAKLFPDFRKIINELQSYASSDGKIDAGILTISSDEISSALFPILKEKDFDACRKWVAETTSSPDDIFSSLYKNMKDYVKPEIQPELILILAQYQDYATRVANQSINLMACFIEMMSAIKS